MQTLLLCYCNWTDDKSVIAVLTGRDYTQVQLETLSYSEEIYSRHVGMIKLTDELLMVIKELVFCSKEVLCSIVNYVHLPACILCDPS